MAPAKAKGQKMALGDFLQDETLGSWADEMENEPMPSAPSGRSGYGGGYGAGGFGSGGFSDRGGYSKREELPLPSKPPYTVHLGNMSFDATQGDIEDFFAACSVTSVRIVEDKMDGKPKGFGYAEFASLDGLKKALEFNGTQFQGRNIRVSVAEPQKDRPDAREFGDWTRKGPLADIPGQRRTPDRAGFGERGGERGFGSRGFDNVSEAGSDRGSSRRPAYEQGDGKVRDFGNWERKGPLTTSVSSGPQGRSMDRPMSRDGPSERKNSPAWGEGRSQDGSRPPRREFVERPAAERAPTAAETDNQWRSKMRPDPPAAPAAPAPAATKSPTLSNRELSTPPSPAAPAAPTVRPKLNLQKRTISEAPNDSAPASATSDAKASPFGAAKPIDTFAREKEIEEKRQLAMRQKKEAEEKAREEKRAADEKAKEEKRLATEAEKADKSAALTEKAGDQLEEKSNGTEAPAAAKSYEILRRANNEDSIPNEEADAEGAEGAEGANGLIVEDKAVKPKEVVRDIPAKASDNAWRNGTATTDTQASDSTEPSADTLEEDGWSTVSKPRNGRRGGNQAARAIAS
ncbi:MAG: RNA-binding domain-containing [Lasallia pustulata]|uniref:RNA-binding domain-containing n=1 Tax=Lasallia pustulata TaxID=136370 RepID=A0A5M8PGH5_9LECA|nr:MAG: RNA-binding domain-containing [Lasallia pustulata]